MKSDIIDALPILSDLTAAQRRELEPVFHEVGFEARARIRVADAQSRALSSELPGLFVVGAGVVRLVRSDDSGREAVLDIFVTGESFGSAVGAAPDDFAVAHTAVCLFHLSVESLNRIIEAHAAVAARLLAQTSERVALLHGRLHRLAHADARVRVAAMLLELSRKTGVAVAEGTLLQLPLSREDLSALCGTTPETATRVVSLLKRRGLLKTGRRWFTITNQDALRDHIEELGLD